MNFPKEHGVTGMFTKHFQRIIHHMCEKNPKKSWFCICFLCIQSISATQLTSQRLVYFIPWHIILRHASTVYNKHGQILTNIKMFLLRNFFGTETKIRPKFLIPPLWIKTFWNQKLSETPKDSATKFMNVSVLWDKKFTKVVIPPLRIKFFDNAIFPKHQKTPHEFFVVSPVVSQSFRARQRGSARSFRRHQKNQRAPWQIFSVQWDWDKKFSKSFCDTPLCARRMVYGLLKFLAPYTWVAPNLSCS